MKQLNIASKVMQEIEVKHVTMRPRWHFVATSALGLLGVVALTGLTVYLINIMTLTIRIQTIDRPLFGARQRLSDLLGSFPWWAAIVAIAAVPGLVWLLRNTSRLYRIRTGWTLLLVLSVSIMLGVLLSISPLNQMHPGPNGTAPRGQHWRQ